MVTNEQVLRYRRKLAAGKPRETAAAMAGMTAKTARKWEVGQLPSSSKRERTWRTRVDPIGDLWDREIVPSLLAEDGHRLQATSLVEHLKSRPEPVDLGGHLRTLQRRVRDWRATNGPGREVYFPQLHPLGREAQMDFTHGEELRVTIRGQLYRHLIFELLLSCSGGRFTEVFHGETFEALTKGLQDGFWSFGGLTELGRSDNLSAASYDHKGQRKPTRRFQGVLDHLGMGYTRIRPGKSNENGVVEKGHDVLKTALDQALILRGSRDFSSEEEYAAFLQSVTDRLNARVAVAFAKEREHLRPLPACRVPDYSEVEAVVRKWSTVRAGGNTYMVSSRLIGHTVTVRQHPEVLEVLYRGEVVESMPRLHGKDLHHVDYRCVIESLVRKPGAFARYAYREQMFPTREFRSAYEALKRFRGDRADKEYLQILHLAARTMESEVQVALELLVAQGKPFDCGDVSELVSPRKRTRPESLVARIEPDLEQYNDLLSGECHDLITKGPEPVPRGTDPGAGDVVQATDPCT